MHVTTVSPANSAGQVNDSVQAQAKKAGAQFEGILLNMVFSDLQRSFTQLPGATQDAVSKSYDGFAMEALTSGLSSNGGIGLGKFVAQALIAQFRAGQHGI